MYCYISENNFGPFNQIIVATGYILNRYIKQNIQSNGGVLFTQI